MKITVNQVQIIVYDEDQASATAAATDRAAVHIPQTRYYLPPHDFNTLGELADAALCQEEPTPENLPAILRALGNEIYHAERKERAEQWRAVTNL